MHHPLSNKSIGPSLPHSLEPSPMLSFFVVPCVILVFSAKSLLPRHDERGVRERKVPFLVAQKVQFSG
jgi:hypothetical protein